MMALRKHVLVVKEEEWEVPMVVVEKKMEDTLTREGEEKFD